MFDNRQTKEQIIEGGMKLHALYVEEFAKNQRLTAEIARLRKAARELIDNIETGSYESTGFTFDYLKALIADPPSLTKGES